MLEDISIYDERRKESFLPVLHRLNEQINQLQSNNKLIKEHFYQTFHQSGIGMAILELDGSFREVNECLSEIFGYTRAEMEGGMCFQDLSDISSLRNDSEKLLDLANGKIGSYKTYKKCYTKAGEKIPTIINMSLIRNNDGEPLYFVSQVIPVNTIANLAEYFEHSGKL